MPRRWRTFAPPVLPAVLPGSPFLTRLTLRQDRVQLAVYPFNIPLLAGGLELGFSTPATFLVGEIGSGKSTCLEALASVTVLPCSSHRRCLTCACSWRRRLTVEASVCALATVRLF